MFSALTVFLVLFSAAAQAATFTVSRGAGFSFTPNSLVIATGDSVTWDATLTGHQLTIDDGAGACVATYGYPKTLTFNPPGTFAYHCPIVGHSSCGTSVCVGCTGMVGTITVNLSTPTPTVTDSPSPTDSPTPGFTGTDT